MKNMRTGTRIPGKTWPIKSVYLAVREKKREVVVAIESGKARDRYRGDHARGSRCVVSIEGTRRVPLPGQGCGEGGERGDRRSVRR